jgi:iron complex transport system substrate-binding protein
VDDAGETVALAQPARRIISLAPHITELLYAAGAGERLIAVVDYSDFPPAARDLPRIGSSSGLDNERIVALEPDLVVAWRSGNPPAALARLRALGIAVFAVESRRLRDLPELLERLGRLAGTSQAAAAAGRAFRERHRRLAQQYGRQPSVPVFYQLLDRALMTVSAQHIISDAIELCGGRNVFADLPVLAGPIDVEAVLHARPQVIVAGGERSLWDDWSARWLRWSDLPAVANRQLYWVDPDLLHRATPRMLDGTEELCRRIDAARRAAATRP